MIEWRSYPNGPVICLAGNPLWLLRVELREADVRAAGRQEVHKQHNEMGPCSSNALWETGG